MQVDRRAYATTVTGGPATAVLGPGGGASEGFSEEQANQVGRSNEVVDWYVELFDGDGDDLGSAFQTLAASVNDIFSPIGRAYYLEGVR